MIVKWASGNIPEKSGHYWVTTKEGNVNHGFYFNGMWEMMSISNVMAYAVFDTPDPYHEDVNG